MSATELKNFCMNVKHLRSEHRLSKTAMAKILGISTSGLNKPENGVMPRILGEGVIRPMGYFHISAEEVSGENR